MKHLWIFVILGATAFGQNAYGPDYLNLHCTSPDLNSNTVFGIPPKSGLVPNVSANGNVIIYCDASTGLLKASVNGSAYGLASFPSSTSPVQIPVSSTAAGTSYVVLNTPGYPEAYVSWNPGTLYPQILNGTCVFAASTTCTVTYPATWSSVPIVNITGVNPGAVTFTLTTSSTSQIVITASASNSLTVNYTAVLPSGINCTTNSVAFPLPGARQNSDFVLPEWPSTLPSNISGIMRVNGPDSVEIRICNESSAAVAFGSALVWGAKLLR